MQPWRITLRHHVQQRVDVWLLLILLLIGSIATLMLYGAADAKIWPWALPHAVRLLAGLTCMVVFAMLPARVWYNMAYIVYVLAVLSLLAVDLFGETRKGAERWLLIGGLQIQPSEPTKIALALCLARYFFDMHRLKINKFWVTLGAMLLITLPTILILKQPDLGTALLLTCIGAAVLMGWGVRWRIWSVLFAVGLLLIPIAYHFLHDYQRHRIDVFLNPELDKMGKGYHILQSKIAIGAGGIMGRGFMKGTQSQLDFLPEKHTDFAFTAFAEQFGFVGSCVLLMLFGSLLLRLGIIAQRSRHLCGQLFAVGLGAQFFVHIFINISMVIGLVPVVGVPLPLFSYGGTSMLTFLAACGVALSLRGDHVHVQHRPI